MNAVPVTWNGSQSFKICGMLLSCPFSRGSCFLGSAFFLVVISAILKGFPPSSEAQAQCLHSVHVNGRQALKQYLQKDAVRSSAPTNI